MLGTTGYYLPELDESDETGQVMNQHLECGIRYIRSVQELNKICSLVSSNTNLVEWIHTSSSDLSITALLMKVHRQINGAARYRYPCRVEVWQGRKGFGLSNRNARHVGYRCAYIRYRRFMSGTELSMARVEPHRFQQRHLGMA